MKTILELFRERLHSTPEKIIHQFWQNGEITDKLSFSSLDSRARAVAARLKSIAPPGEKVLVLLPPGLDPIVCFYACLFNGMVTVPIPVPPPGALEERMAFLKRYLDDAQSQTILTISPISSALKPAAEKAGMEHIRWVHMDEIDPAEAGGFTAPDPSPETPGLMLYTSGSTQQPRGILASHANLGAGILANAFPYLGSLDSIFVLWVPLYFAAGLINTQHVLAYDCTQVLMATQAFIQKPVTWLKLITEFHATMTVGLTFSYRLCVEAVKPEERQGLDLSSLKVAIIGGEPVQPAVIEQFIKVYEPFGFSSKTFQPAYMMSETTGAGTLTPVQRGPQSIWVEKQALENRQVVQARTSAPDARPFISCGKISPEHQLMIVDPDTLEKCEPDKVGEIWVSGPSVAQGYWNKPDATSLSFGAHLKTGEGPFFRTGDLGFVENGELYIVGRIKDVIIYHGRNISAIDLEMATAGSHTSLQPGAAAAFGVTIAGEERPVIMLETRLDQEDVNVEEVSLAVRQAVSEKMHIPLHTVVLVKPGSLPRSGSGKILRYRCRNRYLESSSDHK